jgi:hypothetical protein
MVSRYRLNLHSRRYPQYEKALQATRKALARWYDLRRGGRGFRQVERGGCRLRKPRATDQKQLRMESSLRAGSVELVAIESLRSVGYYYGKNMKPGVLDGAGKKEGGGDSLQDPMISQHFQALSLEQSLTIGPAFEQNSRCYYGNWIH